MESLLSSGAGSHLEVWVESTAARGPIVGLLILLLLGTGPLWPPMEDAAMCSQTPPLQVKPHYTTLSYRPRVLPSGS